MFKNKKIILFIIIVIIILAISTFLIFFNNNTGKNLKIGKNSNSQEIVNYILNISSYETKIDVEIKSNKNTNKYIIKQKYIKDKETTQEVIEPSNIQGVKVIKENNNIRIENTNLGLSKIIEDYNDIMQNSLDLEAFIQNYKDNPNSQYKEENNKIIMETTVKTENKYQKYQTLYISKETGNPEKMEIKDTNKNIIIDIIYNEININTKNEQKIYAFQLYDVSKEI